MVASRRDVASAFALYTMRFRMRTFERRAHEIFIEGPIKGTSHRAIPTPSHPDQKEPMRDA